MLSFSCDPDTHTHPQTPTPTHPPTHTPTHARTHTYTHIHTHTHTHSSVNPLGVSVLLPCYIISNQ